MSPESIKNQKKYVFYSSDTISGESLHVKKGLQIQILDKDICSGAIDNENRCEVDLRELVNGFIMADTDQFLTDLFEVEVISRLSKEQQVRVIFEIKEKTINDMDTIIEQEIYEEIDKEVEEALKE